MESLPKTLPASWYRSPPLYQLEKRGVFLKAWFLLAPITRFGVENEAVDYEMAGIKLSVRRRSMLSNDIVVFNAETAEELQSYITHSGLLFSTISSMAPSFNEYFPDLEPLLARVDFTQLPYRRSIKYEGRFNWKTMVDGYQECLHCQYTHPSFSLFYPPAFYAVHNHTNFSRHIADPKRPDDGLFLYFFPVVTLNVYGGGMSSFRVCPTEDPGVTRMEFDYYHVEEGEQFEEYYKFVRQVALEDFELCEKAQANLEKGIYREGILNPEKESGVAWYQQEVLKRVVAQHEIEKVASELAMEATAEASIGAKYLILPAVAVSFLILLATALFLSRHSIEWMLQQVITPAVSHSQSCSQIKSSHATAYEVSTSRDVPEGWFTDATVFALERRAIFATTWLCITHTSHFQRPGDYLTFNISDYPFFLIMGKDLILRGFHNVCRHRAYSVTRKPIGSSLVLGCRYHGWSYDTKGRLTKAPKFDDIPSFKREENNLYQIWVKTDGNGFVFVNFQGDWSVQDPDTRGLTQFANSFNISSASSMVEFWQAEGDFNWKFASSLFEASDNRPFIGHGPKASLFARLFWARKTPRATCQPSSISALRAIPGTDLWFMTVVEPLSATRSSIRRTLYTSQPASKKATDQKLIDDVRDDFEADLQSLNHKQTQLTTLLTSTAGDDIMTPFQLRLLDQIEAHLKQERKAGTQIFPAAQTVPDKDGNSSTGGVAERCKLFPFPVFNPFSLTEQLKETD
ncbi:hypothetical protein FKW77_009061 [Venturia effusa]|uniref:Choline monooxygenase, chloroplastic n=1 Tax=Venturia effusa TaxID=50376 RepID=A0A517L9W3_9PEZI|nr:hypothetical protein FKW77_009061 [Venturia effusa]